MNTPDPEKEWFTDWFNSCYYHLLYKNRNQEEAAAFIRKLCAASGIVSGSRILDLACGKGRHSITLHELGMQVTGVDLSLESILEADKHAAPGLEFYVHDMRRPFRMHYFDYVFNLFTSFGYFKSENENKDVLSAVQKGLKPGGRFIIDFFNGAKVRTMLQQPYQTEVTSGDVVFHIHKWQDGKHVYKEIRFTDKGRDYFFTERVQLLGYAEFERLLQPHFKIDACYGDYNLANFDEINSDRLILITSLK